jgi:hypothetical protein
MSKPDPRLDEICDRLEHLHGVMVQCAITFSALMLHAHHEARGEVRTKEQIFQEVGDWGMTAFEALGRQTWKQ